MKKMYNSMNIAKGIAIITVVFVHSLPIGAAGKINFNDNQILEYMYNIILISTMPVFFFVSGFFSTKIFRLDNKQAISYIKDKFKRIMIPYFILAITGMILKISLSSFALKKVELNGDMFRMLVYPWEASISWLWFLYSLFVIICIAILFRKVQVYIMLGISFILNIMPIEYTELFNLNGVFRYLLYFYMGLYFYKYYDLYKNYKRKHLITIISLILLVVMGYNAVNFTFGDNLVNDIFLLVGALIGIVFYITISIIFEEYPLGKFLEVFGANSFYIYMFSWFFQKIPRILLLQVLHMNYYIVFISMFISGFAPILLVKFREWFTNKSIDKLRK